MTELVEKAEAIALFAHTGQTDKVGEPYLEHVRRVASNFDRSREPELYSAALLHDVIEEAGIPGGQLRELGVSEQTVQIVELLTRNPEVPSSEHYARIKENQGARRVQLADISDNTDIHRLSRIDEQTRQRLLEEYGEAKAVLEA